MDLYRNKYRISSARAQWWDYSWAGAYFVTICTKNHECMLGNITNGKMHLSHAGVIADVCWYEIKNHAENIEVGEYVVMPNHIHGILILNDDPDTETTVQTNAAHPHRVETGHALSLQNHPPLTHSTQHLAQQTIGQQRCRNQGRNTISSIVGGYKSAVSKHINRLNFELNWQGRFHDHIIRDAQEYERIKNYILNNPAKWEEDKFYVP